MKRKNLGWVSLIVLLVMTGMAMTAVLRNLSAAGLDSENNWWGDSAGPGPVGPAAGERVSITADYESWPDKPSQDNVLYLEPTEVSIYIKPTEICVVDMKVANLLQQVVGLQALLNFNSTYFKSDASGPGAPNIVPAGDGVWDEMIYTSWKVDGDLDVAVGVKIDAVGGTQADGKTAIITLTPTGTEGMTRMVFRPDPESDPNLIASTFFSDTAYQPVWPTKVNSTNIYIDGTPPVITGCPANITVSNDASNCSAAVSWTAPTAADALSGLADFVSTHNPGATFAVGTPTTVTYTATDNAGNVSTCSFTVTVNDTEKPTITCPGTVTVNTDPGLCTTAKANVDLGTPTTGDNCDVALVENDAPDPFPKGDTTVTWTVTDIWGNTNTCEQTVTVVDNQPPVIEITSAQQSSLELIGTSNVAIQGVVNITVTASDNCILVAVPTVTVTPQGGSAGPAGFVNESPTGTFNYTWTVTSSTPNGTATINASVSDGTNTSNAVARTFVINKSQITGTVSFSTKRGTGSTPSPDNYSFDRVVTLVATDSGGTVLASWTLTVTFTNNPATQVATGTYTLTHVPSGTAALSAKTNWHLRQKQTVTFPPDDQGVAAFMLLGGDLDGSNTINVLDYSILKASFNTGGPNNPGNINGDGVTNLLDYSFIQNNWFRGGDAQ